MGLLAPKPEVQAVLPLKQFTCYLEGLQGLRFPCKDVAWYPVP